MFVYVPMNDVIMYLVKLPEDDQMFFPLVMMFSGGSWTTTNYIYDNRFIGDIPNISTLRATIKVAIIPNSLAVTDRPLNCGGTLLEQFREFPGNSRFQDRICGVFSLFTISRSLKKPPSLLSVYPFARLATHREAIHRE